jgi:hypothetical protein
MNQIKFWHLAGWSNDNCPTFKQSYLGSFFSQETQQISTILVGWGAEKYPDFSLPIHQLSLPHVLYTPTIFTVKPQEYVHSLTYIMYHSCAYSVL